MNSKSILCAGAALLPVLLCNSAMAQGTAFNYQGHLSDGTTAATGIFDMRFAVYDASTNGQPAGTAITENAIGVRSGLFSVTLDFGPAAFTGSNRWLEISVRTNGDSIFTTLTPRQPLLPTPYAITAANLSGTLGATQLNGVLPSSALAGDYSAILNFNNESNHYAGDGTALKFGGFRYCALPCYWNLNGNAGTTPDQNFKNFIGTTDNKPLNFRVNGHRALRLEPTTNSPNVIGGFEGNYVDGGGVGNTIGGGGTVDDLNRIELVHGITTAVPRFSTIAGGVGNHIGGSHYATVGGGAGNHIGTVDNFPEERMHDTISGGFANSIIDGGGSTIAGGYGNALLGEGDTVRYSVIGGGIANFIASDGLETAHASTIGGGERNYIRRTTWATIVGGLGNGILFYSDGATIAGGENNFIGVNSPLAFIAGGSGNSIGSRCANSVIGGGNGNTIAPLTDIALATVSGSTVSGGQSNTVTGIYGTVAGGRLNVATNSAFAAGTQAKALHSGSFVWAAGNTNDYPSAAENRVHFYAAGGLAVEYAGQDEFGRGLKWLVLASQEPGKVINVYNGAYLSEGGAWTDTSDRNAKKDFEPVDAKEILERVTNLPLTSWSYRSESNSVRHLGPVAQDFHEKFGLGADDKHIAGLDSSGVALAAIQGLSQELKAKQTEIDQLKQRLEALERRFAQSVR